MYNYVATNVTSMLTMSLTNFNSGRIVFPHTHTCTHTCKHTCTHIYTHTLHTYMHTLNWEGFQPRDSSLIYW